MPHRMIRRVLTTGAAVAMAVTAAACGRPVPTPAGDAAGSGSGPGGPPAGEAPPPPALSQNGALEDHRVISLAAAQVAPHTVLADSGVVFVAGSSSSAGEIGRVAAVDVASGEVRWTTTVSDRISSLALDPSRGTLWAVGGGTDAHGGDPTGGITRLTADSGVVVGHLELPGHPSDVSIAGRWAWVTNNMGRDLWRLDLDSGQVNRTFAIADRPVSVSATPNGVYVANPVGKLTRFDHEGRTVWSADVPGAGGVVANDTSVFVDGYTGLYRFDAADGRKIFDTTAHPTRTVPFAVTGGWVYAWARAEAAGGPPGPDGLAAFLAEDGRLDPEPVAGQSGDALATGTAPGTAADGSEVLWVASGGYGGWGAGPQPAPIGMAQAGILTEVRLPHRGGVDLPGEQIPDHGVIFGYVRAATAEQITFDPGETWSAAKAREMGALDGLDTSPDSGELHDLYDRNRDGRTHDLRFGEGARIHLVTLDDDGALSQSTGEGLDPGAFSEHYRTPDRDRFYGPPALLPCRVTVEGGKVTKVEQVYRP